MLQFNHVSGGYHHKTVIEDVTFSIGEGELVALIGLNGAGKSTTMKHAIGSLTAYTGQIVINDYTSQDVDYRKQLAYVPETPIVYQELTLKEHIEMMSLSYGITKEAGLLLAEPYLKLFSLHTKLEWFPHYFSKGMKQKVMLVCALMLDVPVYIIDEPFLGLDPVAMKRLLHVLDKKRAQGASILLSTHVLSTAEQYCDRFMFMHEGRIQEVGTLAQLQEKYHMPHAKLDDIYLKMMEMNKWIHFGVLD